eukprot:SAG11_NODE_1714_length_4398_cov_2.677832_4_plen_130_part_00
MLTLILGLTFIPCILSTVACCFGYQLCAPAPPPPLPGHPATSVLASGRVAGARGCRSEAELSLPMPKDAPTSTNITRPRRLPPHRPPDNHPTFVTVQVVGVNQPILTQQTYVQPQQAYVAQPSAGAKFS